MKHRKLKHPAKNENKKKSEARKVSEFLKNSFLINLISEFYKMENIEVIEQQEEAEPIIILDPEQEELGKLHEILKDLY